ncbi:uncharacterized protein MONOS_1293 [Monocercomonoides exilis]|uniref:uncharacterized protein n=1 Tax=Monocercomonoides exilis TaxID=2049356 RepID=UPI00355AC99A|nr:hypothetical protein MONOS_1293 [Monocercomonoides exilis]
MQKSLQDYSIPFSLEPLMNIVKTIKNHIIFIFMESYDWINDIQNIIRQNTDVPFSCAQWKWNSCTKQSSGELSSSEQISESDACLFFFGNFSPSALHSIQLASYNAAELYQVLIESGDCFPIKPMKVAVKSISDIEVASHSDEIVFLVTGKQSMNLARSIKAISMKLFTRCTSSPSITIAAIEEKITEIVINNFLTTNLFVIFNTPDLLYPSISGNSHVPIISPFEWIESLRMRSKYTEMESEISDDAFESELNDCIEMGSNKVRSSAIEIDKDDFSFSYPFAKLDGHFLEHLVFHGHIA